MKKKSQARLFEDLTFLKNVDIFGASLPSFTLNGRRDVSRTQLGGVMSLVVLYIIFLFSCIKFIHLVERNNPTVNTYMRKDAFANNQTLSLKDSNFMIAFALEDYFT